MRGRARRARLRSVGGVGGSVAGRAYGLGLAASLLASHVSPLAAEVERRLRELWPTRSIKSRRSSALHRGASQSGVLDPIACVFCDVLVRTCQSAHCQDIGFETLAAALPPNLEKFRIAARLSPGERGSGVASEGVFGLVTGKKRGRAKGGLGYRQFDNFWIALPDPARQHLPEALTCRDCYARGRLADVLPHGPAAFFPAALARIRELRRRCTDLVDLALSEAVTATLVFN